VTDEIPVEEKNNAIKRIKRILDGFEDALKTAENVYEDALRKGDLKIQKEIQKKIKIIKREETSLNNIIIGLRRM
jgi:hypothetical protein